MQGETSKQLNKIEPKLYTVLCAIQKKVSSITDKDGFEPEPSYFRVQVEHESFAVSFKSGVDPGGRLGRSPPKTYESNCFHHNFVQFGKQHSRFKAILSSIVLPQHCCEIHFISFTVVNP